MGLCLLGLSACASVQASEQGQQTSDETTINAMMLIILAKLLFIQLSLT